MAELRSNKDKAVRLATVYRTNNGADGNVELERKRKFRTRIFYEPSNELNFTVLSQRILTDDLSIGIAEGDNLSEISMWNRAFEKLRPPMRKYKRKIPIEKNKFLSTTCEEIIECIRPFTENFEQAKKKEYETNDDVRHSQNENLGTCDADSDEELIAE